MTRTGSHPSPATSSCTLPSSAAKPCSSWPPITCPDRHSTRATIFPCASNATVPKRSKLSSKRSPRWRSHHAVAGHVLERPLRHVQGRVRHPLDAQLSASRKGLAPIFSMDDLSRRAVAAALAVSRNLGLRCSDAPEVIADGSNVLVHLVPAPVVARVATTTALVRKPAAAMARPRS